MDWKAVVAALASTRAPLVVLDRDTVVLHANPAMEAVLGTPLEELEGRWLGAAWNTSSVSWSGPSGRRVWMTLDAVAVGPGTLTTVREACESVGQAGGAGELEYAILPSMRDFGRLLELRVAEVRRSFWGPSRPFCHELLHARREPCLDCPAFAGSGGRSVRRSSRGDGSLEILETRGRGDVLRIRVRSFAPGALEAVRALRVSELLPAHLSERERAVLTVTAAGGGPPPGASEGTRGRALVRAAFAKLEPEARAELARLLLGVTS